MERDFSLPDMIRVELTHEDIIEWIRINHQKLVLNPKREVTVDWSMSYDEALAFENMLERIEDWFSMRNEVPLAVLAVRKLLNQIPVENLEGEEAYDLSPQKIKRASD